MNRMYEKALEIGREKIRGGEDGAMLKKPYLDAAFNDMIFLWDTCFIISWAKYHLDELPVEQSLDNFYDLQDPDGFICREISRMTGKPCWPKEHPISIAPPLLPFAELELHSQSHDTDRLARIYPKLKKYHSFIVKNFMKEDDLFFSDAHGSGMDNIPRYPAGWVPDGQGIRIRWNESLAYPRESLEGTWANFHSANWNVQGRSVDFSAQMAFITLCMKQIASLIGNPEDIPGYEELHHRIKTALNGKCWDEKAGFYFDLGFGMRIPRYHVGMYWTLLADVVPPERLKPFVRHLTDPAKFGRPMPIPALAACEPEYKGFGDYWLGGVWAPTNYMVLRGLHSIGYEGLARTLARKMYRMVEKVFKVTGTFWENYAPEFASYGNPAMRDFCGWSALFPITIYREFVK